MTKERDIEKLLDKQLIHELMCRYCRGVDRLDKELTMSCFWPGAIDVHLGHDGALYTGTAEDYFNQEWEVSTALQHLLYNV
ncbi:hypothetical protein [Blastococcus brunescens]|uniref:SnoaL-like domain-containing protein n=1 Tax=Blastococcus brunescens TaxID=1564165 RepID=A0ABZ1B3W3_9ACTN|nr:hypothetical protein [Blastococcus sp. BMG 8361]WRL65429.1 hypothetical protein U6N30_07340 [Blastococcus sp. BMG 8361]